MTTPSDALVAASTFHSEWRKELRRRIWALQDLCIEIRDGRIADPDYVLDEMWAEHNEVREELRLWNRAVRAHAARQAEVAR